MSTRPLVLLAHGSRRPGPSSVMSRTAERVRTILPEVEVRTGYIELQPPDPATALEGLVDPVVLPFFLALAIRKARAGATDIRKETDQVLEEVRSAPRRGHAPETAAPDEPIASGGLVGSRPVEPARSHARADLVVEPV